ncbi:hypothetical protein CRN80_18975 [Pseudomonas sp. FDAARGOS_380]|jgi:hypothetical protein|nr:hypothetical protein CRN80_18975 [Pseudomonas sp. FDAARGOS_380]KRP84173.1 hypothetical protein TX24_05225 [Pseudomonas lactis]TKK12061.1 hypothetical protein PflCFBP13510_10020 [Pseudomonas fluorescens]
MAFISYELHRPDRNNFHKTEFFPGRLGSVWLSQDTGERLLLGRRAAEMQAFFALDLACMARFARSKL